MNCLKISYCIIWVARMTFIHREILLQNRNGCWKKQFKKNSDRFDLPKITLYSEVVDLALLFRFQGFTFATLFMSWNPA